MRRANRVPHLAGLAFTLMLLAGSRPAFAINAAPFPAELRQPDGTVITTYLRGDEYNHWREDDAGHGIVQQPDGWWMYAQLDARGLFQATSVRVGKAAAPALSRAHVHPAYVAAPDAGVPTGRDGALLAKPLARQMTPRANGVVRNMVVLCLFSDHTVAANGRLVSAFDSLYNAVNGVGLNCPTGSVRDFYSQASYGTLTLQSTVLAWVTLPHTEAYYADSSYGLPFPNTLGPKFAAYPRNSCGMMHDALAILDPIVNFAQYDSDNDGYVDAIDFIHSGYGGESGGNSVNQLWSFKGNLSNGNSGGVFTSADKNANNTNVKVDLVHLEPALWGSAGNQLVRVGVIAHETGHFFGLPDLYDNDYSSNGIGNWCMMANAWGWDQTQRYPPLPSAWCRQQLGWVTPTPVNAGGTYVFPQVETNAQVGKISYGMPSNLYLLVENREPVGFDQQIPQGGLAIWLIDESVGSNTQEGFPGQPGWPGNGSHYHVAMVQADGRYDLEMNTNKGDAGDLFRNLTGVALDAAVAPTSDAYTIKTGNEFSEVSVPGAIMSFTFRPAQWVDFAASPTLADGSFAHPWASVATGAGNSPLGGLLMIKPGQSAERPIVNRYVRVRAYQGTATIGR